MEQQLNYIVFQCYGNEGVFHECAFALLSLARIYNGGLPANTQVWIYTDNPGWFSNTLRNPGIELHFCEVDATRIAKWRGSIDFVHRVKIEVLIDFGGEPTVAREIEMRVNVTLAGDGDVSDLIETAAAGCTIANTLRAGLPVRIVEQR